MDGYQDRREEEQKDRNKNKTHVPLIPTILFGIMFTSSFSLLILSIFFKMGFMNLFFSGLSLLGAILFLIAGKYSTTGKYFEELDEETRENLRSQGQIIVLYGIILLILGILAIFLYFIQL